MKHIIQLHSSITGLFLCKNLKLSNKKRSLFFSWVLSDTNWGILQVLWENLFCEISSKHSKKQTACVLLNISSRVLLFVCLFLFCFVFIENCQESVLNKEYLMAEAVDIGCHSYIYKVFCSINFLYTIFYTSKCRFLCLIASL